MGSVSYGDQNKDEIQEELEIGGTEARNRTILSDFIPIYIPTVEKGLTNHGSRRERRFLDFLRARPSKDWFLTSNFTSWRRFRVPFVRKINWRWLINYFKNWIRDPGNVAMFIWLMFVAAGLILLGLVMLGALNSEIPQNKRRKKWIEIINQILNALFMIMCLYQHPKIFHHLILLLRWKTDDVTEMRRSYCKDEAPRRHERAQMLFVVILLHITCISQYVLCGLYWGYSRNSRPDWAVNVAIGIGIAAPIIAGVYTTKSPLGKKYEFESEDEESHRRQVTPSAVPDQSELKRLQRRIIVTSPEWVGGLFDCCDDSTVAISSFFCTFCVFGWNMERLGFGNMYVHIFTFILLCIAPFLVFGASALSIEDDEIRYIVGIVGIVVCFLGLLYGGYWRIQVRKKFKLPGNNYCCGSTTATDCLSWQLCWPCALAQEVRTANFYDIEDESFYRNGGGDEQNIRLEPLRREDNIVRSKSSPAKTGDGDLLLGDVYITRSHTYVEPHVMRPPVQPLIQLNDYRR